MGVLTTFCESIKKLFKNTAKARAAKSLLPCVVLKTFLYRNFQRLSEINVENRLFYRNLIRKNTRSCYGK